MNLFNEIASLVEGRMTPSEIQNTIRRLLHSDSAFEILCLVLVPEFSRGIMSEMFLLDPTRSVLSDHRWCKCPEYTFQQGSFESYPCGDGLHAQCRYDFMCPN